MEDNHPDLEISPSDQPPSRRRPPVRSDALLPSDITIVVKGGVGEEIKITSTTAQLKEIGELLRGRRKGWGVPTLLISVSASVATVVFSGAIAAGFQYVSWVNSVIVNNATDRITKARDTFSEAANAIGKRYTATRDFVPALQDLVNNQTSNVSNLTKMTLRLDRTEATDYYSAFAQWNVGYNALLVKIDYDLDRPIFHLTGTNLTNSVSYTRTKNVDCSKFITEQMRKQAVGYDSHSLKAQFAIIHRCFLLISQTIGKLKAGADERLADNSSTLNTKAIGILKTDVSVEPKIDTKSGPLTDVASDKKFKISDEAANALSDSLDDLNAMTNTFLCYAKQRQEFYVEQTAVSVMNPITLARIFYYEHIYGHAYVLDYVRNKQRPDALKHFINENVRCDPSYGKN